MVSLADVASSEYTSVVVSCEIGRLSVKATSHVKIAQRREAAWELYRLGRGPLRKSELPEADFETALLLAGARERESGGEGSEVVARALDSHPRTPSDRFQRWMENFRENTSAGSGPDFVPRDKREEQEREAAAQLLVRLWQRGDDHARDAILRLLNHGCPPARVELALALPEEIDFEMLQALLRGFRRSWLGGSARAERIAWIITGLTIFVSGGAALVYLAAEIFKVMEISEDSLIVIVPGLVALFAMGIHRAIHLSVDDKRQKQYFRRIAVLTRQTLTNKNEAQAHRLIPEFKELASLMSIEGKQTANEYRDTLAHLRETAAESLPLPASPVAPSAESLPRSISE